MNAQSLRLLDLDQANPTDTLPQTIETALSPAESKRRSGPPLEVFESVDAIISDLRPTEPVFCLQPSKIRQAAKRFSVFPGRPLYAVKCNPHPFVLETLFQAGITDFDVASLEEVRLIDRLFGSSAGQFFNNPAKSRPAIRTASFNHGIRFYTADCEEEIEKIFQEADFDSDLMVAVRLATKPADARYVLSTKFGAQPDDAARMLKIIQKRGAKAGISFHVGSQCLAPEAFSAAITLASKVSRAAGVPLSVLNVGGGFPAAYPGDRVQGLEHYFAQIVHARRGIDLPHGCIVLCEPGRSLVAEAGTTIVQVVVRRDRAIYINDGVFGTLQELTHPKETRPIRLIRHHARPAAPMASFKVYGPTCDSNDVLGAPLTLPNDVQEGDWIEIGMMGAYSLSMRTHFNGFHADKIVVLGE
ncbi:ornithine decarboxylase [Rhizobium skierniewicense]|uniref:ornithine decarboxylase n=1 Tax=Rhizobium skierniewicense TaxID=984260 RepID=A0A7W6C802_9HYPH|nr:type III PLP-dependent enzyme [Rhizobium skierniewicense]MBB3944519.1 ornithine decarboxylase [Rhizobium skierniewicense]NTF33555.1 type III PLP-dependent enzyme [Rhizobium skierniewicense]